MNYYPVETAKRSNLRHRPIGIGVQGLADVFILLGMPFESEEVCKHDLEELLVRHEDFVDDDHLSPALLLTSVCCNLHRAEL